MNQSPKANLRNRPWNKGRALGQKAPFDRQQAQLIRAILEAEGRLRDLALFDTAIDTMLRASDLLALRVADVCDHAGAMVDEFTVRQQKTGRAALVGLSPRGRRSLGRWIAASAKAPEDYLLTGIGRRATGRPLSRMQLSRLVKQWAGHARQDPRRFSTQSLRRTKAALVYANTRNIEVVRELLGQRSVAATSAYLNVGQKRALEIARRFEI